MKENIYLEFVNLLFILELFKNHIFNGVWEYDHQHKSF